MELPVIRIKSTHPASQGPFVEINKADFDPTKHELFDAPPPPPELPPPPPEPTKPDLLAEIGKNWRKRSDLRALAARINGGRSVENDAQAIQVIETALAARAVTG